MTGDFIFGVVLGMAIAIPLTYLVTVVYMTRNEPHDFTGEHIDG